PSPWELKPPRRRPPDPDLRSTPASRNRRPRRLRTPTASRPVNKLVVAAFIRLFPRGNPMNRLTTNQFSAGPPTGLEPPAAIDDKRTHPGQTCHAGCGVRLHASRASSRPAADG